MTTGSNSRMGTLARPGRAPPGPVSDHGHLLGSLETLDPLLALDAVRRRDLFGGVGRHVGQRELVPHVFHRPVSGSLHGLVTLSETHRHLAAGALERQTFERDDDLLLRRRGLATGLGLLVGSLEAEDCLGHLVTVSYTHLRAHETPEHLVC